VCKTNKIFSCALIVGLAFSAASINAQEVAKELQQEQIQSSTELAESATTNTIDQPKNTQVAAKASSAGKPLNSNPPLKFIQKYEAELKRIMTNYQGAEDPKKIAERDNKIIRQITKYFDFRELAKLALAGHWKKITPASRNEFTKTFVRLIERSYVHRTRDLTTDYEINYSDVSVDGRRATVKSTIKKEDVDVDVVYEMRKKGKNWVIFNMVFDDLNLLNNYRSQFNRIIEQKSFKELLAIMKRKLDTQSEPVS
jgi:phospholipid transport system substrate-binding protein